MRLESKLPLVLLAVLTTAFSNSVRAAEPVAIGSRRELFVDQALIETLRDVRLELQHPQPQEVALECDQPWEGSSSPPGAPYPAAI